MNKEGAKSGCVNSKVVVGSRRSFPVFERTTKSSRSSRRAKSIMAFQFQTNSLHTEFPTALQLRLKMWYAILTPRKKLNWSVKGMQSITCCTKMVRNHLLKYKYPSVLQSWALLRRKSWKKTISSLQSSKMWNQRWSPWWPTRHDMMIPLTIIIICIYQLSRSISNSNSPSNSLTLTNSSLFFLNITIITPHRSASNSAFVRCWSQPHQIVCINIHILPQRLWNLLEVLDLSFFYLTQERLNVLLINEAFLIYIEQIINWADRLIFMRVLLIGFAILTVKSLSKGRNAHLLIICNCEIALQDLFKS